MRKLFTVATALLVGSVGMAQTQGKGHIVNRPVQNVSELPRFVQEPSTPLMLRQATEIVSTIPSYHTDAVNSLKIGSSGNFFGYSNNSQKQLYIMNNLNAVSFVFRNNPTASGAGNSGHLRYNVSSNKGLAWSSTNGAGIGNTNPNQPKLARYPNCVLFSDPAVGGTNANVRVGILAAVLNSSGTGWEGYLQNVVGPNVFTNITTPVIEQEDYALFEGPVFPEHITERVPGEFWATMYSDNTANDTIYVLKGAYDAVSEGILWTYQDKLMPTWNTSVDGTAHSANPKVEFSPDGTIGYVAVVGDLVGGQDSAYVPILWDYNPSTGHFTGGYEVNINQFPQLNAFISSFVDANNAVLSPSGTPTCAFNFDLTVDVNGNPHILCIVGPSSSGVTSPAAYSISSGFAMQVMDITKDYTGGWNMIKLWDQQTFRETLSGSSSISLDPSMHLSRTEDGKYIFYTWSDTDTTGNPTNNANDAPNLKGRFYDVVNDKVNTTVDWTFDDNLWVGNARCPKTPGRVFETGTACPGRTFNVPTVVGSIPAYPDPTTVSDFFYFNNINYSCESADKTPEWFYTCAMNPIVANPTATEPTCGGSNGAINVTATGGVGNYSYEITDAAGNVVSTTSTATGLSAGSYTVMVLDTFGCSSTTVFALNNAGAAVGTASNLVAPTCSNTTNGSMTVCWTGGTAPITVAWYANGTLVTGGVTTADCNTNNTLPAGSITAVITDANGCISSVSGSLTPPSALNIASSYSDVACKDSANGSIVVAIGGGTGTPSYAWTVPTGQTNPGNTNSASGLIPGDYTITVTSGGCSVSQSITLVEPAQLLADAAVTVENTTCNPYNGIICLGNVTGGTPTYSVDWTGVSGGNPYTPTPDADPSCIIEVPGGVFTATITDAKGCTVTVDVTMSGCQVGIESSLSNVNAFKAFPNPTANILNVQMKLKKADNVEISLVNTAGQTVLSRNVSNASVLTEQFNVANLAKGIYFLKVATSEGVAADKIVIE